MVEVVIVVIKMRHAVSILRDLGVVDGKEDEANDDHAKANHARGYCPR